MVNVWRDMRICVLRACLENIRKATQLIEDGMKLDILADEAIELEMINEINKCSQGLVEVTRQQCERIKRIHG